MYILLKRNLVISNGVLCLPQWVPVAQLEPLWVFTKLFLWLRDLHPLEVPTIRENREGQALLVLNSLRNLSHLGNDFLSKSAKDGSRHL